MNMPPSSNLPAQYVDSLVTHRSEIALLAVAAVALVLAAGGMRRRAGADGGSSGGSSGGPGGSGLAGMGSREPPARRVLRMGFGCLWIVDGLLQAQSAMPRQFVPMVIEPALSGQPGWLRHIGRIGVNLWTAHTVTTDAFTVFVQVAIGLAILLGGEGAMARLGLSVSIVWGVTVWVLGEGMGGLVAKNATWLSGAPGSAALYVAGAVVLLAFPRRSWEDGRATRWLSAAVAGFWILGALVEGLPWEGLWSKGPLAVAFASAAGNPQPGFLSAPITAASHLAASDPRLVNAVALVAMAALGLGLLVGRARRAWLVACLVWLGAIWWVGMDFGVVGGTGTDPNSAIPVALFVVAVMVSMRPSRVRAADTPDVLPVDSPRPGLVPLAPASTRSLASWWIITAAAVAAIWTAVPVIGDLPAAASTPAVETAALVDSGGIAQIPAHPPAPSFRLVDQYGRPRSLASWRGKVIFLSFLDPVCYETCPVVAEELAQVASLLAARTQRVEFVAINANPTFRSPATLRAFDAEHSLTSLDNWAFLTGSKAALERVWAAYGAPSLAPQVGMVAHSLLVYVIGPDGQEVAVTQATGDPGTKLEISYANMFADQAGKLLPRA